MKSNKQLMGELEMYKGFIIDRDNRIKELETWIPVDGYKNLPIGEWLVYIPEATVKLQTATAHSNITFIGGHFAFDQKKVVAYTSLPSLPTELNK